MRPLAVLAALAALWAFPVHAQPVSMLGHSQCQGVAISLGFGNNSPNCYNGARVPSYANIPGWTYTGSVSGTGATVRTATDSAGNLYSFANGVPRITNQGILIEQAATNIFLNSATGATQTVTTTAASWTLSFYGTGSITGTGTCTISLSGTGASNRVSSTTTETVGACLLTVSGTVTDVQFEQTPFATSYIPTGASAAVTRAADRLVVTMLNVPLPFTVAGAGAPTLVGVGYIQRLAEVDDQSGKEIRIGFDTPEGYVDGTGLTATLIPPSLVSQGQSIKIAASNSLGVVKAISNNTLPATTLPGSATMGAITSIWIGDIAGGLRSFDGYISSIKVLPRAVNLPPLTQ